MTETGSDSPGAAAGMADLSFEDALAELETIVRSLEEGPARLDDAIGAYERGVALKRHCEKKLGEAKAKVDRIVFDDGGAVGTEPSGIE